MGGGGRRAGGVEERGGGERDGKGKLRTGKRERG